MHLSSGTQIPDGLLAAMTLRNENSRLGVPSQNQALHQGFDSSKTKSAIGLQTLASTTRIRSCSTGKERDAESGLDNFEARYAASSIGRFMSPDPSGLYFSDPRNPQSLNLYSYVFNNPIRFIDPTGLDGCQTQSGITLNLGNSWLCGQAGAYWDTDSPISYAIRSDNGHWELTQTVTEKTPSTPSMYTYDATITLSIPSAIWQWAALQKVPAHGPLWHYKNWAGPGGAGVPVNDADAGAMVHDHCYWAGGFGPTSNFKGHNDALQACNQALCDTEAKVFDAAEKRAENYMAQHHRTISDDDGGAALDMIGYFQIMPFGNACKVHQ